MAEWKEVATQWKRMCKVFWTPVSCKGCPIVEHERAYGACSAADIDVVSMEEIVMSWAVENPEPVYPSWAEWLLEVGGGKERNIETSGYCGNTYVTEVEHFVAALDSPIPEHIAKSLHIAPKEG